jgi:hypothetical protein
MQKIPLQQQDMAQLTTQIKQWGLELGFGKSALVAWI